MDIKNTGKISATNIVPTEDSATALSAVTIRGVEKSSTLLIQVSGAYTGALSFRGRSDPSQPWVATSAAIIQNAATNGYSSTIASGTLGIFRVDISGYSDVQVTALAAVTGEALVTLKATSAPSPVSISNATIPTTIPSSTTSIAKTEDAVAATGDTGVFVLGVRRDAPTISGSATGDYNEFALGRHGQLYTQTIDAAKRTYAAAFKVTPFAGTILEIFGAASTTVEINRITLTLNGTAAGKIDVAVNKRSAVATGGTAITAPAKVPYDSADAAAVSTVKGYSAAPTAGTLVGLIRQAMLDCGANVPSDRLKLESGQYSKSFMLTSATQAITVDLAGTMPTGAELAVDIEWTEF